MGSKIRHWIVYTGMWSIPVIFILMLVVHRSFWPNKRVSIEEYFLTFVISAVSVIFIWNTNDMRRRAGKPQEEITLLDAFGKQYSEFDYDDNRNKHMYPPVNPKLLYSQRTGYVFGKPVGDNKHYVCCDIKEGQRIAVFAGSGAGKTQQSLCFIAGAKHTINSLIIDPKKEITRLVYREGDNTKIFDPEVRINDGVHVGYNPFFMLNENSTQQDIYECMNGIAIALISVNDSADNFWKLSARDLLTGLFCYFYQEGKETVPDIVEAILSKPIQEVTEEVLQNAEPYTNAYKICTRYHGMADETITSINSNLVLAITPYAVDQRLVYSLKYAPVKFTPETLLTSSVYVAISLPCIESWASLVTLIVNQFITWGLSIPDYSEDSKRTPMCLVFEEFTAFLAATGRIDKISQALRFIRSKNISIITICQSISAIKAVYRNDEEVNDMLSNYGFLYFMDCTEPGCQKWICDMAGTFKKRIITWNDSGAQRNGSKTISYQDEPIVRPQDLITLGGTDEAILISHIGGYNRIKKTPAWKEPGVRELLND